MFGLKKINDDSIAYKIVKNGVSGLASIGGVAAFDAVVVPCVQFVWRNNPFIKFAATVGTLNLSIFTGLFAKDWSDSLIEFYKESYNLLIADQEDEEKEKVDWRATATRAEEIIVNDTVAHCGILEFKTLEEAQHAAEWLQHRIQMYGYATIQDLIDYRGMQFPDEFSVFSNEAPLVNWGWDADELGQDAHPESISIDKIRDDLYILNLVNYKNLVGKHINLFSDFNKEHFWKEH